MGRGALASDEETMRPRVRDVVGAVILSVVLVALVVLVVVVASQGS